MAVTAIYLCAFVLTLQVDEPPTRAAQGVAMKTPWADLGDGIAYARSTPPVLAALLLACLANFAAYPISGGLLPHVARDVYGLDRTGLGYLSASFAGGAMLGSLFISARGGGLPPARTMLAASPPEIMRLMPITTGYMSSLVVISSGHRYWFQP